MKQHGKCKIREKFNSGITFDFRECKRPTPKSTSTYLFSLRLCRKAAFTEDEFWEEDEKERRRREVGEGRVVWAVRGGRDEWVRGREVGSVCVVGCGPCVCGEQGRGGRRGREHWKWLGGGWRGGWGSGSGDVVCVGGELVSLERGGWVVLGVVMMAVCGLSVVIHES